MNENKGADFFSSFQEQDQILVKFIGKNGIKITALPPDLSPPGSSLYIIEENVSHKKWLCSFYFPISHDEEGTVKISSFDELDSIKYSKSKIKDIFGV